MCITLISSLILAALAHWSVSLAFHRYSRTLLETGGSGAEVARRILDGKGLHAVGIELISGRLSDHYNIRDNVIRLSERVYNGDSVAAASIAAHEAGHAIQHAKGFLPARLRNVLLRTVGVRSSMAWLLIAVALLGALTESDWAGVVIFAVAVLFLFVALVVELDASRRAMVALSSGNDLPRAQLRGATMVLMAAAFTYLVALLIAVLQLGVFAIFVTR